MGAWPSASRSSAPCGQGICMYMGWMGWRWAAADVFPTATCCGIKSYIDGRLGMKRVLGGQSQQSKLALSIPRSCYAFMTSKRVGRAGGSRPLYPFRKGRGQSPGARGRRRHGPAWSAWPTGLHARTHYHISRHSIAWTPPLHVATPESSRCGCLHQSIDE